MSSLSVVFHSPVAPDSGELATVRQVCNKRRMKTFFKQEGASPILNQCSPAVSPARSDLTFDPDKPPTPRPRRGSLGLSEDRRGNAGMERGWRCRVRLGD